MGTRSLADGAVRSRCDKPAVMVSTSERVWGERSYNIVVEISVVVCTARTKRRCRDTSRGVRCKGQSWGQEEVEEQRDRDDQGPTGTLE